MLNQYHVPARIRSKLLSGSLSLSNVLQDPVVQSIVSLKKLLVQDFIKSYSTQEINCGSSFFAENLSRTFVMQKLFTFILQK